jgi:hypothetical protein
MRFGTSDLRESWQDRLERELVITESDFELLGDAARHVPRENPGIQFGQWPTSRGIHFDRERSD